MCRYIDSTQFSFRILCVFVARKLEQDAKVKACLQINAHVNQIIREIAT